jgi:phospholipid/cholesterol/gamma-HCH transport system substrate-binding protein
VRRLALIATLLAAGAASIAATAGADDTHTYKIEMYNAFGIVEGSDVRIVGVNAGSVKDLEINEDKRALVTVELAGELSTLGQETTCSTEPQSLIAEYFISCDPKGPPLEDNGTIPADRVSQTVQTDLVQNTLREPFKRRLQLLINEFGTALAGNAENLNEAIRLGAPALTELRKVTRIIGQQNAIIRDLNVNSDRVIGELTARREDVVRFIQEARDTARASAERRDDLSRDFEVLDDFLGELRPTLGQLENLAREQTPLLTDLRAAAPGLNTLAQNLPPFNEAGTVSLDTLGDASEVGKRALSRGADEIRALADSGRRAPVTTEMLKDFVQDLNDPRRAVEIDDRVPEDTGRTNPEPGQPDTKGFTTFEAILNYAYRQTLAINQFDRVGHLLHFNLNYVFSGPCGAFSSGRNETTGEPGVPAAGGGTTTHLLGSDPSNPDPLDAARCIGWLGDNQPGINTLLDGELPQYDPSVCPNGTKPEAAELTLCDADPNTQSAADAQRVARAARPGGGAGGPGVGLPDAAGGPGVNAPPNVSPRGPVPDNLLDDLLNQPGNLLGGGRKNDDDGGRGGGGGAGGGGAGGGLGGAADNAGQATQDLLDFLFGN